MHLNHSDLSEKTIPNGVFLQFLQNKQNPFLSKCQEGVYISNEKLYNKKVERNIKPSDFAPHVDDLCMAISMMNKETSLGSKLGRIIPLALIVPGYQTGIAQEKEQVQPAVPAQSGENLSF